ncbi:hypothetical protein D3C75_1194710 [compost metagenome]
MWVFQRFDDVGCAAVVLVHLSRGTAGGVIAEGDKIDAVFEDLTVAWLHCYSDTLFLKQALGV